MHKNRPFYNRQRNQNHGRTHNGQRGRRTVKKLDPRFFVQKAVFEEISVYQPKHSFADFDIAAQLKNNIINKRYNTPTPIQDEAIPHLLAGRDVVGIASTGTGKTAAFLIPLIHKVYKNSTQRVLIVAPTRELALQIDEEFKDFSKGMNLFSVVCIGGVSMKPQIDSLRRNTQFVIGTPGRLRDLENQRQLSFHSFSTIVLDEVDRMLDMGFVHEVKHIIHRLPTPRQSLFFSATLPEEAKKIMAEFLHNPVTVAVSAVKPSSNVDQDVINVNGQDKVTILQNLLDQKGFEKVLVFGRTKWGIEKLSKTLLKRGYKVAAIHGNKSQGQRQRAIEQFKNNKIQALLATDVASRGLDIQNVTHVINYDQPESYEDYIHRIGRTGRAHKKGIALTFVD